MTRAALSVALGLLVLGLTSLPGAPPAWGQDPAAPPAQPSEAAVAESDLLRTRGVSAWRSYVWTLDRSRLEVARNDLVEARRLRNGLADFTHVYLLAYCHLALGEREDGAAALAEARSIAPTFAGLMLPEAFALILDGKRDAAIEVLDRYVERLSSMPPDPGFGVEFDFLAHAHRGVQSYEAGNYDAVVKDLGVVLRLAREADRNPPNEAVLRLALAHQMLQEFPAAEDLVRAELARDPANAGLYYNLGLLAGTRARVDEARRWHVAALARRPGYPDPHLKLAFLARQRIDEDPAAIAEMRRHLDAFAGLIGPSPTTEQRADLAAGEGTYWLSIGRLLDDAGAADRALRAYERALQRFKAALEAEPGCLNALTRVIRILYLLDRTDEERAPYMERERQIRDAEDGAPAEHRSTFC